jgi:hypothetical protein
MAVWKRLNSRGARLGSRAFEGDSIERNLMKRVRAVTASLTIITVLTPFWLAHFVMWFFSLAGAGAESLTFFSYFLPGQTVFFAFSLMGAVWGLLLMGVATIIFTVYLVDWYSGFKIIAWGVCLALSMAPLLFGLFPYVFLWCGVVVLLQTGQSGEEE